MLRLQHPASAQPSARALAGRWRRLAGRSAPPSAALGDELPSACSPRPLIVAGWAGTRGCATTAPSACSQGIFERNKSTSGYIIWMQQVPSGDLGAEKRYDGCRNRLGPSYCKRDVPTAKIMHCYRCSYEPASGSLIQLHGSSPRILLQCTMWPLPHRAPTNPRPRLISKHPQGEIHM
jgi:hypothetical protein